MNAGAPGARYHLADRIRRHLSELARLSAPAMASRLGILAMAIVDTVMVARYATVELAWLALANRSVVSFLVIVAIGLLMGTIVMTSKAYGAQDLRECGRVWRRTLPYALAIGVIMMLLTLPAPYWMSLLAADPEVAAQSAQLVLILGLGLPAHLLFFCSIAFLEGVRRPYVPMVILLSANLLNVLLNYALVFGHLGAPELGAAGSAWSTTVVRWTVAVLAVAYILKAPGMREFGVRLPHGQRWREWARQRTIGYASAISIATEVAAFAGLAVIAEKLGALELAGQEIVFNVLTVPFMVAIGIGAATAVRIGIAHGRDDPLDTAVAGWTGLGAATVLLAAGAILIALFPHILFALHSADPELAAITVPAIAFIAYVTVFDGTQATISMGLRGLGETWWPTAIQATAFLMIMLPLSWHLAMTLDRGLIGLLEATLIGCLFAVVGQSLRFWWLTRHAAH